MKKKTRLRPAAIGYPTPGLHRRRYSARLSIIATARDSWWRMAPLPSVAPALLLFGLAEATGADAAGRAAATTGFFFFAIGFFGGVTACRVT